MQAEKAMWSAVNAMDAVVITQEGINRAERAHASEMDLVRKDVKRLQESGKLSAA